jgi:hypothetical protein
MTIFHLNQTSPSVLPSSRFKNNLDSSLRADPRYAVKSHANGRSAHHSGCNEIACTPRFLMRYPSSCKRGNAALTLPPGPVQNTSADAAARGHTIGSRFCGPDCSVQSSCCPPSTSDACAAVRFASGSKVYACAVRKTGEWDREEVTHVLPGLEGLAPAVAWGVVAQPPASSAVLFTTPPSGSMLDWIAGMTHQVERIRRRVDKTVTLGRYGRSVLGRYPDPKASESVNAIDVLRMRPTSRLCPSGASD